MPRRGLGDQRRIEDRAQLAPRPGLRARRLQTARSSSRTDAAGTCILQATIAASAPDPSSSAACLCTWSPRVTTAAIRTWRSPPSSPTRCCAGSSRLTSQSGTCGTSRRAPSSRRGCGSSSASRSSPCPPSWRSGSGASILRTCRGWSPRTTRRCGTTPSFAASIASAAATVATSRSPTGGSSSAETMASAEWMAGGLRDITIEKTLEQAREESAQLREVLFKKALVPTFLVDSSGVLVDASQSALDFLHADRDELVGRPGAEVLPVLLPGMDGADRSRRDAGWSARGHGGRGRGGRDTEVAAGHRRALLRQRRADGVRVRCGCHRAQKGRRSARPF